jgi:hypothetical protein
MSLRLVLTDPKILAITRELSAAVTRPACSLADLDRSRAAAAALASLRAQLHDYGREDLLADRHERPTERVLPALAEGVEVRA